MVFRIKYWVGLCCMMAFGACGKKDITDYAHYLTEATSGLTQKQSKGKMFFSATYQPLDFVAGRQLEADARNENGLKKAKDAYLGLQYVNFELYTEGAVAGQNTLKQLVEKQLGEGKWTETLSYYNFGMQSDLGLISGTDTLPCAFCHLEQTGNLGNRLRFFVGFKDDKKVTKPHFVNDLRLYYIDRTMSKDTLYFTFSKDKLNQTPDLKL